VAAGRARAVLAITQSMGGQNSTMNTGFDFRKIAGAWKFSGNGRVGQVEVRADASLNQGLYGGHGDGPAVTIAVLAPQGTVRAATASVGGGPVSLSPSATVVSDAGLMDNFNLVVSVAGALPAAGTVYEVTMVRSDGSTVTYAEPLNAFTTEGVRITSPGSSALSAANLGGTLNVSWTPPRTYAVAGVELFATAYTGPMEQPSTFRCETAQAIVGANASSGALNIPANCNGLPVRIVDINLGVTGTNGEHSQTHYGMQ